MSTEQTTNSTDIAAAPADELADAELDQVSGGAATPPKKVITSANIGTSTAQSSTTYGAIHG